MAIHCDSLLQSSLTWSSKLSLSSIRHLEAFDTQLVSAVSHSLELRVCFPYICIASFQLQTCNSFLINSGSFCFHQNFLQFPHVTLQVCRWHVWCVVDITLMAQSWVKVKNSSQRYCRPSVGQLSAKVGQQSTNC